MADVSVAAAWRCHLFPRRIPKAVAAAGLRSLHEMRAVVLLSWAGSFQSLKAFSFWKLTYFS